jgi:hypothetical protein
MATNSEFELCAATEELMAVEGGMSDAAQKFQLQMTEANRIDEGSGGGSVVGAVIRRIAGFLGV